MPPENRNVKKLEVVSQVSDVNGMPFTPGCALEKTFFSVTHSGMIKNPTTGRYESDTRGIVRYESPVVYFEELIAAVDADIDARTLKLRNDEIRQNKGEKKPRWGDDDDFENDPKLMELRERKERLQEEMIQKTAAWRSRRKAILDELILEKEGDQNEQQAFIEVK